ncbi:MAG: SDR family NAD(P)-dependent oxidoreductase, partial [Pirellula sp.]
MIEIDLTGRVAVVTGGVQGIGRATATMLHRAGASVAINYYDDEGGLSRLRADEVAELLGDRGFVLPADVRSRPDMEQFFSAVQSKFGRIDFLVNNAAILRDRTVKNLTDEEWNSVIETNLSSVFRVCQAALAH